MEAVPGTVPMSGHARVLTEIGATVAPLGPLILLIYLIGCTLRICVGDGGGGFQLVRIGSPDALVVTRYQQNRYPLFSGPYRDWATLKTGGKQVQYGRLVPALCVADGRAQVIEHPVEANRRYRQAQLWVAAGPVLVRAGKACSRGEIRSEYRHLDTDGATSRVVLLVWKDGSVGFLFHPRTSLWRMQSAAVHLKVDYALNLDGGSCTVWQPTPRRRHVGREVVAGGTWCIGLR
jgi:hypothetical protein